CDDNWLYLLKSIDLLQNVITELKLVGDTVVISRAIREITIKKKKIICFMNQHTSFAIVNFFFKLFCVKEFFTAKSTYSRISFLNCRTVEYFIAFHCRYFTRKLIKIGLSLL